MKKLIINTVISIISIFTLCSCSNQTNDSSYSQFNDDEVYLDPSAPVISFTPQTENESGAPEYYLFDDNPEHLNSNFLADGAEPSSIAHFEDLGEGIYTVFSYHHRGYSVDLNADLYFDTAFSSASGATVKILNLGLNHDWDWNQAWADYTNSTVLMPEYLETINCTCIDHCVHTDENSECSNSDCAAVIRNEKREPNTSEYNNLNNIINISSNPTFLSDCVDYIEESGLNHFRYGSYNEPMWLMMKFEIVSGTVDFDTLTYQNKTATIKNFSTLKKGAFDYEPQYKGIANNAPIVTAEFDYTIDNNTKSGPVPVTVKNSRVPNGITIKNGTFATNVNTWREKYPIAVESDIMKLTYIDNSKLDLYGDNAENKNNVWHFDPYHTKLYSNDYDSTEKDMLRSYGINIDNRFEPNISMTQLNHPKSNEIASDDFYKYTALNLGNFGVTNRYIIHIANISDEGRVFKFEMSSIAGQVYKFKQTDESGNIIYSDNGNYYMKKFDADPAEDPSSTSEPKARINPPEHSSVLSFDIDGLSENTIEIEITTLTGCTAPMHNTMYIE